MCAARKFGALEGFKARGVDMGASFVEDEALDEARRVEREAGEKLVLPVDLRIARKMEAGQDVDVVRFDEVPYGWMSLDVGPGT